MVLKVGAREENGVGRRGVTNTSNNTSLTISLWVNLTSIKSLKMQSENNAAQERCYYIQDGQNDFIILFLWSMIFSKTGCHCLSLPTAFLAIWLWHVPHWEMSSSLLLLNWGRLVITVKVTLCDVQGLAIKGNTASAWLPWSTFSWNPAAMQWGSIITHVKRV